MKIMEPMTVPRKALTNDSVHPSVAEKLELWGRCIRLQRVRQGLVARDLCSRLDVSDATLRRMEQGDPRVNAAAYLSALNALGILDMVVPRPDEVLWTGNPKARAANQDSGDEYF